MTITGETRVFAVIGDPVSHSASPLLYNAGFGKLGIDAAYVGLRVRPRNLKKAVEGMRAASFGGFNVTAPHKQAVIACLDGIDSEAARVGAVNTVVNRKGKLRGFNTDVAGFKAAMERLLPSGSKVRAVVLGAGGAARAALHSLPAGSEVAVMGRKKETATEIAKLFPNKNVSAMKLTKKNLEKALQDAELLVNATPVGLNGSESLVPPHFLRTELTVLDMAYSKGATKLVRQALARGCLALDGREMLLQQALEAFRLFTGKIAPEKEMEKALEEVL